MTALGLAAALAKLAAALIPILLAWWAERVNHDYSHQIEAFDRALAAHDADALSAAFERMRIPSVPDKPYGPALGPADTKIAGRKL